MKWTTNKNLPLFDALAAMAPECSKSTLRSWLKDKRVLVDGATETSGKTQLNPGQTVSLSPKARYLPEGIQIIYQDKDVVVVDKPETLLSVATNFEKKTTVHGILKDLFRPGRVYPVHRLDQDTSGIMMFALNEEAQQALKADFEKHNIERYYGAIVEGQLDESEGVWNSYLYEDGNYVVHSTPDKTKGSLAITHYRVIDKSRKHSWLELRLETGKKNQIRVHCRDAGHPVVGDKKYGAKSNTIKRLCLHAHVLAFHHPRTKKLMRFTSSFPQSFYKLIRPEK